MIYSKTSEYAIRALTYFASHPEKARVTVTEVSRSLRLPEAYVGKVFRCLARSRILRSWKGPHGGFSLLVPVRELSLVRVVSAVDEPKSSPFSNCVMGLDRCDDRNPCPLHPVWSEAKSDLLAALTRSTVADIADLTGFGRGRRRWSALSKRMKRLFKA